MPTKTKKPVKRTTKTDPEKRPDMALGDLVAFFSYGKVKLKGGFNGCVSNVDVRDCDHDRDYSIHGAELVSRLISADAYEKTEEVTKTRAAELLLGAGSKPFSVNFEKQDGENRTLRGRLVEAEPLLGRSMVEDLDLQTGSRLRQVDHRTINWLILAGVKYVVRK